jgi:hypothetical protein
MTHQRKKRTPQRGGAISRRHFLQAGVVGAVGVFVTRDPGFADDVRSGLPTFFFRTRRGRDLLDVELRFVNFTIQGTELVALGSGESKVVVRFPPQHLAEAAFTDPDPQSEQKVIPAATATAEPLALCRPPVESYLSGPSWIVFRVPDSTRLPLQDGICRCGIPAPEPPARGHDTSTPPATATSSSAATCPTCCQPAGSVLDYWFHVMADWTVRIPRAAKRETPPPGAKPKNGKGKPTPITIPTEEETSIEIPFRLMIAPTSENTRVSTSSESLPYDSIDVRERNRTYDLWHAAVRSRDKIVPNRAPEDLDALTRKNPDLAAPTRINLQARAVYSPDYTPGGPPPFELYYPDSREISLRAVTRYLLVDQMAHGDGVIDVENLILTAIGGNAILSYSTSQSFEQFSQAAQLPGDGSAVPPSKLTQPWIDKTKKDQAGAASPLLTLASWRHRIVVGRDAFYVQAFYVFGMPFLYPSLYVEVTQRSLAALRNSPDVTTESHGPPGAFLLSRRYILIQNPLRQFPDATSSLGRMMPIKKAVLVELRSPFLLSPKTLSKGDNPPEDPYRNELTDVIDPAPAGLYFIPRRLSDGQPVRWKMLFEDGAGKQAHTDDPCLLFASNAFYGKKYWDLLKPEFRRWNIPPQDLCYAPHRPEIIIRTDKLTRLTALAAADSSGDSSRKRTATDGRAIINDVVFAHTLLDEERKAARVLGDAIRGWLQAIPDPAQQLVALKKLATATFSQLNTPIFDDLRQQFLKARPGVLQLEDPATIDRLTSLSDATIQAIGNAAEQIESAVDQKTAAVQDLLAQLGRCEQVGTALETHLLNFACTSVGALFDRLATIEQSVKQILLDHLSVAEFVQQVVVILGNLQPPIDPSLKTQIESQLNTLTKGAVNTAEQAKATVLNYIAELKQLNQKVSDLGTQYFQATLQEAKTVIPALKAMASQSAAQFINLVDDYALQGITQVRNGVFAALQDAVNEGKAMADQIKTGLAAPAAIVQGIARDVGAVVADGQKEFEDLARPASDLGIDLKGAIPDAKLFGVIPLRALVGLILKQFMPKMHLQKLPEYYEQNWEWLIPLEPSYELPPLALTVQQRSQNEVRLRILLRTRVDFGKPKDIVSGKPPTARVTLDGYIGPWDELGNKDAEDPDNEAFRIVLADLIAAKFTALRVQANYLVGENVKPSVKPDFLGVEFLGPLQFLNDLENLLSFGDFFKIEITPIQIGVNVNLEIPPLSFGVFSLANVTLGTALRLPLDMRALRFEFSFSSWTEPFELTVMCLGGRGYFMAALQSDGLRELQAALEFGGALDFSVAVASGGLYIMAGGYLRIDNSSTVLAGYLRAGGHLDVLGLITATVEFLLMLAYRHADDESQMYGIARLTIHVSIVFVINVDVTVEMEKTIVGSKDKSRHQFSTRGSRPLSPATARASAGLVGFRAGRAASPAGRLAADSSLRPCPIDCYFTRETTCHRGRFDWDADGWTRAYWSQFDLASCN